jgi:hypothetical protein
LFTDGGSNAAPWEISNSSIPGLPYLTSFLKAVCVEMANKDANAMAKKSLAAGPGASNRAVGPSPSTDRQPSKMGAIIAAILIGTVALIVLLKMVV